MSTTVRARSQTWSNVEDTYSRADAFEEAPPFRSVKIDLHPERRVTATRPHDNAREEAAGLVRSTPERLYPTGR